MIEFLKLKQVLIHNILVKKLIQLYIEYEVDRLDTDELEKVPTGLNTLKSKVDALDVNKLVPVPLDLSKLSDRVKNDIVKRGAYNAKMKDIEHKILEITKLLLVLPLTLKQQNTQWQ